MGYRPRSNPNSPHLALNPSSLYDLFHPTAIPQGDALRAYPGLRCMAPLGPGFPKPKGCYSAAQNKRSAAQDKRSAAQNKRSAAQNKRNAAQDMPSATQDSGPKRSAAQDMPSAVLGTVR